MGTRSSITVKVGNKFLTAYCHWDGYLSHNGNLLLENYNSQEKGESLVALGDISSLDKSIECPEGHSFGSRVDGYTVFYGRDRGESDVDARECKTFEEAAAMNTQEYNYFWDGEKWMVDGEELTKELIDSES